jgi:3-dehydroquinate synthase
MISETRIDFRLPALSARGYRITLAAGLIKRIPQMVALAFPGRRVWIVTDSTVLRLHGRSLQRSLVLEGIDAGLVEIPPGEDSKNEGVVYAVQSQLLEHGIDRDSIIIALGGGVVGDVAGFVAATVLRGVACIQVPTTLLAQVDSSVGGKVGINHPLGKNLIGAFHQPSAVWIDPAVLSTLPPHEFRSGLAEVIKIVAALDAESFSDLERICGKLNRKSTQMLLPLIVRAVRLKAAVVALDEREGGLRKVLNLGHTIGHAVEAAGRYSIRHGEAVAIGLAVEAGIAAAMGVLSGRDEGRLLRVLRKAGLPTQLPRALNRRRLLRALSADKKSEQGDPRFVLLQRPGHCLIGVPVPAAILMEHLGPTA